MSFNVENRDPIQTQTLDERDGDAIVGDPATNAVDTRLAESCLGVVQDYRDSRCTKAEAMGRLLTVVNEERGRARPELAEYIMASLPVYYDMLHDFEWEQDQAARDGEREERERGGHVEAQPDDAVHPQRRITSTQELLEASITTGHEKKPTQRPGQCRAEGFLGSGQ
jgi:hypothetical protein